MEWHDLRAAKVTRARGVRGDGGVFGTLRSASGVFESANAGDFDGRNQMAADRRRPDRRRVVHFAESRSESQNRVKSQNWNGGKCSRGAVPICRSNAGYVGR